MVMGRSGDKKIPRHLCLCGCGQQVKKNRSKFIRGHNTKFLIGDKNSFYRKVNTERVKQCAIIEKQCIGEKI
jgi:hypothetical protein